MNTTVIDTMEALYAACKALSVPGGLLDGVTVVNGPRVTSEADTDRLFIGADIDTSGLQAEGDNSPDTLPGIIDVTVFSIVCVAEAWGGSTDAITDRRTRTWTMRSIVADVIRPSPDQKVLGVPGLQSAYMGGWRLFGSQVTKGLYTGCEFRIEFITRPSTT